MTTVRAIMAGPPQSFVSVILPRAYRRSIQQNKYDCLRFHTTRCALLKYVFNILNKITHKLKNLDDNIKKTHYLEHIREQLTAIIVGCDDSETIRSKLTTIIQQLETPDIYLSHCGCEHIFEENTNDEEEE